MKQIVWKVIKNNKNNKRKQTKINIVIHIKNIQKEN